MVQNWSNINECRVKSFSLIPVSRYLGLAHEKATWTGSLFILPNIFFAYTNMYICIYNIFVYFPCIFPCLIPPFFNKNRSYTEHTCVHPDSSMYICYPFTTASFLRELRFCAVLQHHTLSPTYPQTHFMESMWLRGSGFHPQIWE